MPLKKVAFVPGFNKQDTPTQAEGQWIDGDNVRFRYAVPEKIGGWYQPNSTKIIGSARAGHSWTDLAGTKLAAFGTDKVLAIYTGGACYDITPLGTTIATCTYTSTTGSSTVTINKTSHTLDDDQLILFSNITIPAGSNFTATNFTGTTFAIQTAATNTFEIKMPTTETGAGVTAAGNVDIKPYEVIGPSIQTFAYGFGTSTWGLSTWGTARPSTSTVLDAAQWSLDNYGENLIATIHNGKTFEWDPSAGAALSTRATLVSNAPTASVSTIVSDKDRHLIFLGTETVIGSPTTQDKMFIRFSDQEDINEYTAKSTNTAGSMRIDQGTSIVAAVHGKDYTLILTDKAAYIMQFVGPPYTFSIRQVGSDCGCMSAHSAIYANGKVFWMGVSGGFFVFDGTVKSLPCLVEDFVFTTNGNNLGLNSATASDIIYAGHNNLYSEVMWFYAKNGSTNIDRVVTYNYDENIWTTGTLDRTVWVDSGVEAFPLATDFLSNVTANFPTITGIKSSYNSSILYEHERGTNEVRFYTTGYVSSVISSSISSGDFDLDVDGDGQYFMSVRRFIPDFKYLNGTANVTINLRKYPSQTQASSPLGPFTISSSTTKVDTRARSRQASLKIESNDMDGNWRFGLFRFDSQPDGMR